MARLSSQAAPAFGGAAQVAPIKFRLGLELCDRPSCTDEEGAY